MDRAEKSLKKAEWEAVFNGLEPLIEDCTSITRAGQQALFCDSYKRGGGYPAVQSRNPQACVLVKCTSLMSGGSRAVSSLAWIRFHPVGNAGKWSSSKGYFVVLPNTLLEGTTKPIYLHRLICWMFRGKCPASKRETGHTCEHKCCIHPLHLEWVTRADNVQGAWDKRKRRREEDEEDD